MSEETRLTIAAAVATALAALALTPLLAGPEWLWVSLGAIAVPAIVGETLRRAALPTVLTLPCSLVVQALYFTALFARSEALLGFVPGPEALRRLGAVGSQGFIDIQSYAAPVPTFGGIVFVTAAGVGVVAVLVDLVAVRLRKVALAGLPLLAVFSVTSAIQESAGWIPFILAATGFTGLLMVDARERLGHWGRRVPLPTRRAELTRDTSGKVQDAGTMAAAARRIGVVAIAAAIVLPILLPQLPAQAVSSWLAGIGRGGGSGPGTVRAPSPLVSLKRDLTLPTDRTVLRYRTNDSTPSYLRIYVLDRFNGKTWSMTPMKKRPVKQMDGGTLPRPRGLDNVPAARVHHEITINRDVRGLRYLPLPSVQRRVEINGQWRVDRRSLMVFSRNDVAAGRTYEVTSWELHPTRQRLASAPPPPEELARQYTRLPEDLPKLVTRLARKVTRGEETAYGKAMALQEWFTDPSEFSYSLDVQPGGGSSALVNFLRDRVGYCQQFASAMAVMARELGIPARVAVGYTAGNPRPGNLWVVSTHDAHAWPELYFHGVGWVRFEPTPSVGGQATATTPTYARPRSAVPGGPGGPDGQGRRGGTPTSGPLPSADTDIPAKFNEGPLIGQDSSAGTSTTPQRQQFPLTVLAVILALVVLAFAPTSIRGLTRWRRWSGAGDASSRAHAAWAELCDDMRDFGDVAGVGESPRALARRVAAEHSLSEHEYAALWRLTYAEERACYAPTPGDAGTVRTDVGTVRQALARSAGRTRTLWVRVLPPSTLRVPRWAADRVAIGLNHLDTAGGRLRSWLSPKRKSAG